MNETLFPDYDSGITTEKWLELIQDKSIFTDDSMCVMRRFLDIGGEATCKQLVEKYGEKTNFYNVVCSSLAQRVLKKTTCREPPKRNNDNNRYWPILFDGRSISKKTEDTTGSFIWILRSALKEALKIYMLLDIYKAALVDYPVIALDQELYKWEVIKECKQKNNIEIINILLKTNLIDTKFAGTAIKALCQTKEKKFSSAIDILWDEKQSLQNRLDKYKSEIEILCKDMNMKSLPKDERMASALLTCHNPEKYTFYMDNFYSEYCKYLGIEIEKPGKKYIHYLGLISRIAYAIQLDKSFAEQLQKLTEKFECSFFLFSQNILYTLFKNNLFYQYGVETMNLDKYINQLKISHNIILTGAPGTGKTYLAKEIAKAMGATENEIGFVQFHPSYDYTDFVEGLRPCNSDDSNGIGFERRDGVFKEFCKKALKSKTINTIDNFNESWEELITYLNENDFVNVPLLSNKEKTFLVVLNEYGDGLANRTYENDEYSKDEWIRHKSKFFNKEQLYNIYRGLPGTPAGGHDNYRKAIVKVMKEKFHLKEFFVGNETEESAQRPFIFIIDEINRGEISKIFGELFFSIDPGYRGIDGLVKTQYQNLITEDDEYYKGFFVPKNVYIIGTMNDIDRSVESMDFAMRRRFTWMEVTAEEGANNMELPEESKERMRKLNEAIAKIDGLNFSYFIGGAYFKKLQGTDYGQLWNYHLEPLLKEYLRGNPEEKSLIEELESAYNLVDKTQENQTI